MLLQDQTKQYIRRVLVTYEPALMMDFTSNSALLMLATHMTMQTTPAQAQALTCTHTQGDVS